MTIWQTLRRPFTVLAPMEDVTDTVFRRVIAGLAPPDLFFTEFTGADGIYGPRARAVRRRLVFTDDEQPIVAQIWGNNPEAYRRAAREISLLGFAGIDINMGCPVKKIARKGFCSALIENRSLAAELILAAAEAGLPVSVKTRTGISRAVIDEWFGFLLEMPLAAITVHGRLAAHDSEVPADWAAVRHVARLRDELSSKTIIVGNGDVARYSDAIQRANAAGADGVMVGRGVFANPLVFDPQDRLYHDLPCARRLEDFRRHLRMSRRTWGSARNFHRIKKFVKAYLDVRRDPTDIIASVMETQSYEQAIEVVERAQR